MHGSAEKRSPLKINSCLVWNSFVHFNWSYITVWSTLILQKCRQLAEIFSKQEVVSDVKPIPQLQSWFLTVQRITTRKYIKPIPRENKTLLTMSITPWKVISNVTFTTSDGAITGLTLGLVSARTRWTKSFSLKPDAPRRKQKAQSIWS